MKIGTEMDYLFETSWEVCNKVGGIYTVLSTKAKTVVQSYGDHYICIGPDLSEDRNASRDFEEDKTLYKNWVMQAAKEGLQIRIGRWKIKGNPIVILVDFTPFFEKKNEIFTHFWLENKLDSINGQWDYIEPALFGYASARVIESFYNFYVVASDKIVAHFHEWMTGTGALYLHNTLPQIATVFTTHATALGRCIAGNGLPLYSKLKEYNPCETAGKFHIQSKHCLEMLTAQLSDSFTTVSNITKEECEAFLQRQVDIVTINGFENDFVPQGNTYREKRETARKKLKLVTEALLQQPVSEDALFVINSGRYEYKNKGIDIFIEGLSKLKDKNNDREVIAIIAVPAGICGVDYELLNRMQLLEKGRKEEVFCDETTDFVPTTHFLQDSANDPVINGLKKYKLNNHPDSKVKVIFVPVYLNGHDGIFNLNYYDLLIGFDLSIFPSYYEPWGYTPLEGVAFGIPTITTTLAGFGRWAQENFPNATSVHVIERNDFNDVAVSNAIADILDEYLHYTQEEKEKYNREAIEISKQALWENLYSLYLEAYKIALEKSLGRYNLYQNKTISFNVDVKRENIPTQWNKITVKSKLPDSLLPLITLANNLWWSWNYEARELFEELFGTETWKKGGENPVSLLQMLSLERIEVCKENKDFLEKLNKVYTDFSEYMQAKRVRPEKKIAYFSMEFGISNELKIFSGGLGMLAGDYLKEASDCNVNMIGIGLLYRYGYFTQQISHHGEQVNLYPRQSFSALPIQPVRDENGNWQKISLALPGRNLYARIWKADVGRIPLYLLDTDFDDNRDEDRETTASLYGGDHENRLKQEILLGIGGIRMLNKIGENPCLYHLNEGHAAFLSLERLRSILQGTHLPLPVAVELLRTSSLYTTHTPVPAGHDLFSENLMRKYFSQYPARYNISWEDFMALGRSRKNDSDEKFSMSILACKLCGEINGVSKIHGDVTKEMFTHLYEGYFPEELPIGYVTNGVHYPTWAHKEWQKFHKQLFGEAFERDISNPEIWQEIYDINHSELWFIKNKLRDELFATIKILLNEQMLKRSESPSFIVNTLQKMRTNALTIGFARRFATYKRAYLLFSDEEKLNQLVNHPERPVNFIFAGKAHPNDKAGQDLIRKIVDISRKPQFIGKIIFLENYDMILAKKLISGCDVWLNTPTRPLEASGTSGEKAAMNGVLNFSVLDGWWAEGYKKDAGWAINEKMIYKDSKWQDEMDAVTIYSMLEEQIAPAFYEQNKNGIPEKWVMMMKNNFVKIAPHFTMKRQLDDYYEKFYHTLEKNSDLLQADQLKAAFDIVKWKKKIFSHWDNIEVVDFKTPDVNNPFYSLGENLFFEISLLLSNLSPEDIGVEIVFTTKTEDEKMKFAHKVPFEFVQMENQIATFRCSIKTSHVGIWNWAVRLKPQHTLLSHNTYFDLTRWV